MRKITKNSAPHISEDGFYSKTKLQYRDLNGKDRNIIRKSCILEQKGLCAFCCCSISVDKSENAHLLSQNHYPELSLNWDNIVASCSTKGQCNNSQKSRTLPITPLMIECERDIKFCINGHVIGITQEAKETIRILNLNNPSLIAKRKKAIEAFFFENSLEPVEELTLWDEKMYQNCIALCEREDENNMLIPYAPILISVFRQQLCALQR